MNEKKTTYEITADDKVYKFTIKEPDFKTYARAMNLLQFKTEEDTLRFVEAGDLILVNCIVNEESDVEIMTNNGLRVAAAQACVTKLDFYSAEVKKS
jgi:hypothetical protein